LRHFSHALGFSRRFRTGQEQGHQSAILLAWLQPLAFASSKYTFALA
jgi:hypothetical protein